MKELAGPVLRGDILKILYYQDAFSARTRIGSLMLWAALREAGHHDRGLPLGRDSLEEVVDELAARGLVRKSTPGAVGRLLTDYEAHLTRKGRGLLEGALPAESDILIGEL
ncbi:MAG: hypothetical protein HOC91_14800 [Nitrospinaceae bacterium]|nr:hypothetical protein [Nitrospinaceae bacterium]MBT3434917.1 hypothetical protein [Nitrospinaceae bacterium]MBT4094867.1 hypothetical protein [Nitrospinaceae bacterium]MBT4431776.1 hypothetical protein [Nitrospinaceae bacterium]MBT5368307.1 hypothetical protein [Nitrospinaceae bacterium]